MGRSANVGARRYFGSRTFCGPGCRSGVDKPDCRLQRCVPKAKSTKWPTDRMANPDFRRRSPLRGQSLLDPGANRGGRRHRTGKSASRSQSKLGTSRQPTSGERVTLVPCCENRATRGLQTKFTAPACHHYDAQSFVSRRVVRPTAEGFLECRTALETAPAGSVGLRSAMKPETAFNATAETVLAS